MKKILIALGCVAAVCFLLLLAFLFYVTHLIHQATGPALYSSVGAWTRIDEYAHVQGKTNYINYADKQLAILKSELDGWQKNTPGVNITNLENMQATSYANMDRGIKSGQNPLAFLDGTNAPPPFLGATN